MVDTSGTGPIVFGKLVEAEICVCRSIHVYHIWGSVVGVYNPAQFIGLTRLIRADSTAAIVVGIN